jgi:pilus assembly protein CpaB
MERSRLMRTVLVPLLVGVLATMLVSWYIGNEEKRLSPADVVPIVVASRTIPAKTVLTQDMLRIQSVPRPYAPVGSLHKTEEAIGRVSTISLIDGEPIAASRVALSEKVLGLAHFVPPGLRAVTVAVNEITGNAGFPEPGDRVDVMATFTKEIGGRDRTDLVLENVQVLAIVRDSDSKSSPSFKDMKSYTSMTLAVTPSQAATLVWSEERGKLRMLLRPDGAGDLVSRAAADSYSVLGYQPPAPKTR